MDQYFEIMIKIALCILLGIAIAIPVCIALKSYEKQTRKQMSEFSYVIRSPKKLYYQCLMATFVFYIFTTLTIFIYKEISNLLPVIIFLLFTLGSVYTTIYCLLWNVFVDKNALIIYNPGFPLKKIRIYDISEIKLKKHRIVGYVNNKIVFSIDDDAYNFNLLCEDLYRVGKIIPVQIKEEFSVTLDRHSIISDGLGIISFGGLLIVALVFVKDELDFVYYLIFILLTALSLDSFIESMLWKVTVTFKTIEVKKKFRKKRVYSLYKISKVYVGKDFAIVFVGEKEIVKIFEYYANFQLLMDRLYAEGIVFYKLE